MLSSACIFSAHFCFFESYDNLIAKKTYDLHSDVTQWSLKIKLRHYSKKQLKPCSIFKESVLKTYFIFVLFW